MADLLSSVISQAWSLGPTLLLIVASQVLAEVLLWLVVHIIKPLTAHTQTTLDDFIVDALPLPIRIGGLLVGLWLAASNIWPTAQPLGHDWLFMLGTLAIVWAGISAARLANALVLWYYHEISPKLKGAHGGEHLQLSEDIFPMARRAIVYFVYLAAFIVLLQRYDIEITPLLTGLGIAGLAVAISLQDSLTNFFAGVSLLANKPIRVGDFIALEKEDGPVQGFVEEVGWRMTRMRSRGNVIYYIPNSKLASTVLINFSRGVEDNWKGGSLMVPVDYDADVDQVKKVLIEAVKEVQKKDARITAREPGARLEQFGDSALVFIVYWTMRNLQEKESVAGEVREAVFKALRANKIKMPFPHRVLQWSGPMPPVGKKKKA